MRSTMAFTVLILVVLLGYQYFIKPTPPAAPQTQSQTAQQGPQAGQTAGQQPGAASGQAQLPAAAAPGAATTPSIGAAIESETTVENELYKIVFTNRGAQVKHWILKNYIDSAGKPLDMVQPQAAARFGLPLSLFTYEPALTAQLNRRSTR